MVEIIGFPRMLFSSDGSYLLVQDNNEYATKKSQGWSDSPVAASAVDNLKAEIEFHQQEYIRLRGELDELIGVEKAAPVIAEGEPAAPALVVIEEPVKVETPVVETPIVADVSEETEEPLVSRRGRKPKE